VRASIDDVGRLERAGDDRGPRRRGTVAPPRRPGRRRQRSARSIEMAIAEAVLATRGI